MNAKVPFKTPVDYWVELLNRDPRNMARVPDLIREKGWYGYDCDLHVYPYIEAQPAMLSMGCPNKCSFCPTAAEHKGNVVYGNYSQIIYDMACCTVHFMDENFFRHPDIASVLRLLKGNKVQWLAMSDYKTVLEVYDRFGTDYLYESGCRCIEVGLENVCLMQKCKDHIPESNIEIYYLNMTLLPGETIQTIKENSAWMKDCSLKRPIHFNNGLWYAPGQFYYPYGEMPSDGLSLPSRYARTRPTYAPNSLILQDVEFSDLEQANYYGQLVYGLKYYPEFKHMNIADFLHADDASDRLAWLCVGIRSGAIE